MNKISNKTKGKISAPRKPTEYEFKTQPESALPIAIKGYAKGLKEFSAINKRIRQNIGTEKLITPIISWLDEIESGLADAKMLIQKAIEHDSYTDIREQMAIEGESFCSSISDKPRFPSFSGATEQDELVIEQVIDYLEDLCDRITNELMDVYYYLMSAKF